MFYSFVEIKEYLNDKDGLCFEFVQTLLEDFKFSKDGKTIILALYKD